MTTGEALKDLYKKGMRLRVNFTKLNGEEREMTIKRLPELEAEVKGCATYHFEDRLRVCEVQCADGEAPRWRCIPLERVNYFVCENE